VNDNPIAKKTKGGNFPKFLTNLVGDPHYYGDELIEYIQEYENELINFIPKTTYLEAIIIACGEVGANWMLDEKVINDEIINKLIKKIHKGKITSSIRKKHKSILALLYVEQAQNRILIDDDLISLIVKDVQKGAPIHKRKWTSRMLAEIELFRKDGKMIEHIIHNYDGEALNYWTGKITWDDRIYDFLIKGLDEPWWYKKITGLYTFEYLPSKGIVAAEALLKIGKEHGIRKVFLRSAEIHRIINEGSFLNTYMNTVEWCVENYNVLSEYIFDYLDNMDLDLRHFIVLILAEVKDERSITALKKLQNDSNDGIRFSVKEALNRE
jgi:hypothetical protein